MRFYKKQILESKYDNCKSFYGKAYTEETDNRIYLISYQSYVGYIDKSNWTYYELNYYPHSRTTNRHIKEFKLQNGIFN